MYERELMDASCRVALAALLHDIGKFAERARIQGAEELDAHGTKRRDINIQLYCPQYDGRYTHIHAAYTAIAFDLLERHFPEIVGEDMFPFAPWSARGADDSVINAAAMHHQPETFLQWIIATADRVASGFEREKFEQYNTSSDEKQEKGSHYAVRQLTIFEQIQLSGGAEDRRDNWHYPLRPMSPESIFPMGPGEFGPRDSTAGQAEYRKLWQEFVEALKDIPESHRASLPLWLDHFESLWQCFTHAIPSATFKVRPDVSLYDHSKAVAALAVALWRYHHDRGDDRENVRKAMSARADWDEEKLLLIQGDFSGIQDFIFSAGGETQRRAAKLLRGRSFYVSLLTECAALKVLETLSLPSTSQVINAAGKFLIVAPNTEAVKAALQSVQDELDSWFLDHTYGLSGIGLAWLPARCNDFLHGESGTSPFQELMRRLFDHLDEAKLRRFRLAEGSRPSVFQGFLERFDPGKGECKIDGRSPAQRRLDETRDIWVSNLAYDQVMTGKWLSTHERLLIARNSLGHNTLMLPLFGYHISFTRDEEITGRFGAEARSGNLVRAWDFSLPESGDAPLWNGYARRYINAYVPRFGENEWESKKYHDIEDSEEFEQRWKEIKTLNHIACDDRRMETGDDGEERPVGLAALMTLKGDVDNLGLIMQRGMKRPTFAKMAALSRQLNAFFCVWLPWQCRKEFVNTYTVFAGGDDFFLIGPWHSTIALARRMRQEFARYVASNPEIHFSAALSMTKPGLPIRHLARFAEDSLDRAKNHHQEKNSVTCYSIPVTWQQFEELMKCKAELESIDAKLGESKLSTAYVYALLTYTDMAEMVEVRPENALWHSQFVYRTRRMLESSIRSGDDPARAEARRSAMMNKLAEAIAHRGIETFRSAYKIALFTWLYQKRK